MKTLQNSAAMSTCMYRNREDYVSDYINQFGIMYIFMEYEQKNVQLFRA